MNVEVNDHVILFAKGSKVSDIMEEIAIVLVGNINCNIISGKLIQLSFSTHSNKV